VLALAATFGTDRAVSTKYQATSTFSLLASDQTVRGTAAVPGTNNAFLSFDTSLNDMADFLVRRLNSPDDGLQLQGKGVTEVYSAALAAAAVGPFNEVCAHCPCFAARHAERADLAAVA